ncbi:unnamed protein product [Closterium sp. Yama58-4]|nr:unnamed protein product [Closterium sp. Yama58-4]
MEGGGEEGEEEERKQRRRGGRRGGGEEAEEERRKERRTKGSRGGEEEGEEEERRQSRTRGCCSRPDVHKTRGRRVEKAETWEKTLMCMGVEAAAIIARGNKQGRITEPSCASCGTFLIPSLAPFHVRI